MNTKYIPEENSFLFELSEGDSELGIAMLDTDLLEHGAHFSMFVDCSAGVFQIDVHVYETQRYGSEMRQAIYYKIVVDLYNLSSHELVARFEKEKQIRWKRASPMYHLLDDITSSNKKKVEFLRYALRNIILKYQYS